MFGKFIRKFLDPHHCQPYCDNNLKNQLCFLFEIQYTQRIANITAIVKKPGGVGEGEYVWGTRLVVGIAAVDVDGVGEEVCGTSVGAGAGVGVAGVGEEV